MQKLIIVLALGTLSSVAIAGTIGPSCGSCFGGTYTLDALYLNGNATAETWRIKYTLETQNVTGSGISYVGSIAAKVSSNMLDFYAVSGGNPTTGGWTNPKLGGLNNAGCTGSGAGWVCIAWTGVGDKLLTGASAPASYSWVFDVKMATGSLLSSDASIKANFDPASGKLLSEKITVPEGPSPEVPILLSGLGLWMFGRNRWKRRMAA